MLVCVIFLLCLTTVVVPSFSYPEQVTPSVKIKLPNSPEYLNFRSPRSRKMVKEKKKTAKKKRLKSKRGESGRRRKNRVIGGSKKNGIFKRKGFTYDSECKCGVTRKKNNKIVGGENAKQFSWPWAVSMVWFPDGEERYYCGGSVITDRHILTAAHCLEAKKEEVIVRLGDFRKNKENNVEYLAYGTAVRDPNYVDKTASSDIAIVTLNDTINFKKFRGKIAPICLPKKRAGDFVGTPVVAVGWGTEDYMAEFQAEILKQVDLITVSNDECKTAYKPSEIDSTMICAIGSTGEGKDSCQGDSGGPLVTFDSKSETYTQVGIVSWGEGCGLKDIPGVYSRVTELLKFIKKQTKKNGVYCT